MSRSHSAITAGLRTGPCGVWLLLIFCAHAGAQETTPRIGYAFPAGARQGTTLQVTVGGQYLNEIRRVYFSGTGITARVLDAIKPLSNAEVSALRERLTQLMKEKPDDKTGREIAALQRKLSRYMGEQLRRQVQPGISETVALQVTIAADAEPGQRELRIDAARGVSNPLRFVVGQLPEYSEQEPELTLAPQDYSSPIRFPATVTTDISLPAVVNGQIVPREPDVVRYDAVRFTPGDADRYRFTARRGQQLVIAASARALVPYLADAVPGWFQATLTLYDQQGKELAYADDYHFHPDPVLFFPVPADGQYIVEVKDAIYRGRPDFVYRIAIGELPFLTGVFPLGGPAGAHTAVQLTGWNLSEDRLTVDAPEGTAGIRMLCARRGDLDSNSAPFAIDTLPECLEDEALDPPSAAQKLTLPTIVNGRIDRAGDWDTFCFPGRAGERIIAEVVARRLGSPLDSVLELTDSHGKRLALNDDHEDKAAALMTHQADSLIDVTLPADGEYHLRLGDAQHAGSAACAYRLRVSPPQPDFALRVVPSCINTVAWRLVPVTVFALRRDGFDGEIALSFKDAPEGVVMTGGLIPARQDRVRVTLATAPWLPADPIPLCLEGRATIAGAEVVRTAVAADDMMQAFAYKHLVPANQLTLVLPGSGSRPQRPQGGRNYQSQLQVLGDQRVKIPAGGSAEANIRTSWSPERGEIQFELSDPPEGIVIERISWQKQIAAIALRCDAAKAQPGLAGNLIAHAFQKRTETNKEGKTREYRSFLGPLPAIPFEVVKP